MITLATTLLLTPLSARPTYNLCTPGDGASQSRGMSHHVRRPHTCFSSSAWTLRRALAAGNRPKWLQGRHPTRTLSVFVVGLFQSYLQLVQLGVVAGGALNGEKEKEAIFSQCVQ